MLALGAQSRPPPGARTGLAEFFGSEDIDPELAYQCVRGIFTMAEASALLRHYGFQNGAKPPPWRVVGPRVPTIGDKVSYLELTHYMRNQLLRDSDVMSMAWSIELRVPFVDRRVMEEVTSLPARWRLAKGKQILLDAVPEIPEWVRNRPKQGFTFPFRDWVTSEWGDVFTRIESESPVPLQSWYRTWCLFALDNFVERNRIEGLGRG